MKRITLSLVICVSKPEKLICSWSIPVIVGILGKKIICFKLQIIAYFCIHIWIFSQTTVVRNAKKQTKQIINI